MFSSCEVSPLLHFVLERFQNNSSKKDPNKLQEDAEKVSGRVLGKITFCFCECTANDVRYSVLLSETPEGGMLVSGGKP